MRFIFLSLAIFTFTCFTSLLAQPANNSYRAVADSDPAAKKIVDALRKQYDSYSSIKADFRLAIEIPGQAVETQRGQLSRSGDLFHFTLGKQEGISDGKAIYVILHDNKEVQINNLPSPGEEAGMLTPQSLFSFYDQGQYILALQGEEKASNGKTQQVIEMKPSNRDQSEFTKLRMLVDKSSQQITQLLAFSRDGSRFTFFLDKVSPNPTIPASTFAFKKENYPGYYVEDLRF